MSHGNKSYNYDPISRTVTVLHGSRPHAIRLEPGQTAALAVLREHLGRMAEVHAYYQEFRPWFESWDWLRNRELTDASIEIFLATVRESQRQQSAA
jgi:hypothetical protein